jgi:apoptosis-stimulating of p53 protein 1
VAAVEPYNHTPQKSTSMTSSNQQHQQIIQDLAILKLKSHQQQQHSPTGLISAESDESKLLARQKQQQQSQELLMKNGNNDSESYQMKDNVDSNNEKQTTKNNTVPHPMSSPSTSVSSTDMNVKKNETKNQTLPYKFVANNSLNVGNSNLLSHKIISSVLSATAHKANESDSEKAGEQGNDTSSATKNQTQIVSSMPLNAINKSVAEPLQNADDRPVRPKALHQSFSGNLVVPPRKPISSVAPTSITLAPKTISQTPKVNMVAPNNNIQAPISSVSENDKSRPALPPKPNKNSSNQQNMNQSSPDAENNNLPIKAKPLTIKKQPLSEQPKLRSLTSNLKTIQYTASRRIEMPPAFLFPEIATAELKDNSNNDLNGNSVNQTSIISKLVNGAINISNQQDIDSVTSADETDKSITPSSTPIQDEKPHSVVESIVRRKRNLIESNVKAKLARRVSFDPLALLLDASLEGELELVKKTAMQVTNPSAANDEGITALHNAICAGHLEIVKYV